MSKHYQRSETDSTRLAVPEQVSVALGEIAADVGEGLLALAVGAGLQVMQAMMEADEPGELSARVVLVGAM